MKSKISTIKCAVDAIQNGSIVAVGGNTNYRCPIALALEIINQEKRNLTLVSMTAGLPCDMMIGAGCVEVIRSCYMGLEIFGLAPMFRQKVENGEIKTIEETETTIAVGLRANLAGLAFLPARCLLGTDLLKIRSDIRMVTCPYTGELLPALPAIKPDVALIHSLAADEQGNAVLGGNLSVDIEIAQTSEITIISSEAVITHEEIIKRGADIIGLNVDYVIPLKHGAYPTSCFPEYLLDGQAFLDYIKACQDDRFGSFITELYQKIFGKI